MDPIGEELSCLSALVEITGNERDDESNHHEHLDTSRMPGVVDKLVTTPDASHHGTTKELEPTTTQNPQREGPSLSGEVE
ncbi:hypothetical protein HAX54_048917 [Datura stramonium]|uniref:Uncharacterized protein n=1 Tax=Datura stramonium TaxID=4076 RepID=A0ABS8WM00_DATST|nr:hypothetical protein [Datura stramonium]